MYRSFLLGSLWIVKSLYPLAPKGIVRVLPSTNKCASYFLVGICDFVILSKVIVISNDVPYFVDVALILLFVYVGCFGLFSLVVLTLLKPLFQVGLLLGEVVGLILWLLHSIYGVILLLISLQRLRLMVLNVGVLLVLLGSSLFFTFHIIGFIPAKIS